jgi:hypothetical protein
MQIIEREPEAVDRALAASAPSRARREGAARSVNRRHRAVPR